MRALYILSAAALIFLGPGLTFGIELKTGAQKSSPKFFLNEEGEMCGLEIDIMRALEEGVEGLEFVGAKGREISFIPWKRQQKAVEIGELDVIFGFAKTDARLKRGFVYIDTPLYTVRNVVAVRADDPVRVDDFEDIVALGDEGVILAVSGTGNLNFLERHELPLKIDSSAQSPQQTLNMLLLGRGRFFFYHDLGLKHMVEQAGLLDEIKILPARLRTFTHHMAFSPEVSPALVARIEEALKGLEERGELQRLFDKYTKW